MGAAISDPQFLLARRRANGRQDPLGHGQTRGAMDRGSHQFRWLRNSVRTPLGRGRTPPLPPLRTLLLSAIDYAIAHKLNGWRPARRANTNCRADIFRHHLLRPLHRRSGLAPLSPTISRANVRMWKPPAELAEPHPFGRILRRRCVTVRPTGVPFCRDMFRGRRRCRATIQITSSPRFFGAATRA